MTEVMAQDDTVITYFSTKTNVGTQRDSFCTCSMSISVQFTYNHATSNLAIYSHETSQDKLPEA